MNISNFIKEWWDNEDWWFNSNKDIDQYLTNTYQHLLDIEEYDNTLDYLILYDQLPRHIFRNTYSNHIITFYLNKSLNILKTLDVNKLSDLEWCFAMLPIRHSKNKQQIYQIIKEAWNRLKLSNNHILKKFIKASYERFPLDYQKDDIINHKKYFEWNSEVYKDILQYVPQKMKEIDFNNKIVKEFLSFIKDKNYILSLSGGVDSMVCFHILSSLKNINLKIVHINYSNRKTANIEEQFLIDFTSSHGFDINIRRICEINRHDCMHYNLRDIYESYTRNVRYYTYLNVDNTSQVILGHNKDDCLENIFTNIASQNKYDNLNGMTIYSHQNNINFLRPLLNISKNDIIEYANQYNIPYLPNSTPTWSQRGQIRNNLVPCLNKWDINFIPGLYKVSDIMSELYQLIDYHNENYYNIIKNNGRIKFDNIPFSKIFWNNLLTKLYNQHISSKSLDNFLFRIKNNNKINAKIIINKNIVLEINNYNEFNFLNLSNQTFCK